MDMGDIPTSNASSGAVLASTNRSFLGRRRFSTASVLTLASLNSVLPQYAATDDTERVWEDPPVYLPLDVGNAESSSSRSGLHSTSTSSSPNSSILPKRYSFINPRHSTILSCPNPVVESSAPVTSHSQHEFQYSYPIKSNKPWATLHLYTRDAIPGNPRPSKSQPKVPCFWSCDPVAGMLQLDFDSPQTIQQIIIMVRPATYFFYLAMDGLLMTTPLVEREDHDLFSRRRIFTVHKS